MTYEEGSGSRDMYPQLKYSGFLITDGQTDVTIYSELYNLAIYNN